MDESKLTCDTSRLMLAWLILNMYNTTQMSHVLVEGYNHAHLKLAYTISDIYIVYIYIYIYIYAYIHIYIYICIERETYDGMHNLVINIYIYIYIYAHTYCI